MDIPICFLLLVAEIKKNKTTTTKINLGREGLISSYTSRSGSISEETHQELETDRTREETMEQ